MHKHLSILATSFFASNLAFASEMPPIAKQVGSISVANPAFLSMLDGPESASKELIISTFQVFGTSTVSRLSMTEQSLGQISKMQAKPITTSVNWPNDVTAVPKEIFGEHYVAIGSGFLTPGSNTGAVNIANIFTGEIFPIIPVKKDYFYHRVLFADINGDGRIDAITARAKKSMFGSSDGEILWLEQPADKIKSVWKEHLIAKGPDVHFVLQDLDNDGNVEIISAEFFSKKLSVQWQEAGVWQSKVIDATVGSAFDLEVSDLNGDGKLDLLVSNHESTEKASIFAYEIPADFKTAAWTRHTLLSNIKTEKGGFNQAAPGSAFAVQPTPASPQKKPWIIAGGDGSTKVHRLVASSDDPNNWNYVEDLIFNGESTIGQLSFSDIDGDGRLELFVPAYDDNKIYVFNL
ncbi:MAG: VCBS repeat-containing protein [Proteobacteria bacterium]|nr:VCBS repeat-containing protein [Pseudomonadota bacterium]